MAAGDYRLLKENVDGTFTELAVTSRLLTVPGTPAQPPVISRLNNPPGTPTNGDRYLIGTSPTGAWGSHGNKIATYSESAWVYDAPVNGWDVFVTTEGTVYLFRGGVWAAEAGFSWGNDLQLMFGKALYHRQANGVDSEKDYRELAALAGVYPYKKREYRNPDFWIPENEWFELDRISPGQPLTVDITYWVEQNIKSYNGELPDKGLDLIFEIQYWMNHYYHHRPTNTIYHRTLTALRKMRVSMIRGNVSPVYYAIGNLVDVHFDGVGLEYDSTQFLYDYVKNEYPIDPQSLPVSFTGSSSQYLLELSNELITYNSHENGVMWEVYPLLRITAQEYSKYERTNEIIN